MYSDNDNDYVDETDSQPRITTKRKNRTQDFNETDKKKLASLVKTSKLIWDCTNILHSNASAVDKSWTEISLQMGKPKDKCKLAWTALRESYRYHARSARSGDPLGNGKNWPFAKELSFLAKAKRVQKAMYPLVETQNDETTDNIMEQEDSSPSYLVKEETCPSFVLDLGESSPINNIATESRESLPNGEESYDGPTENDKVEGNTSHSRHDLEIGNFIHQLGKLVNTQNEFMRNFRGTDNFAYRTQLVACDALLQQLPKKIAETTLIEIQNYILKKINDQQKRRTLDDS